MVSMALDSNYDLKIGPYGIVLEETTNQDIAVLLKSEQGELKEDPKLGVGIEGLTNDDDFNLWNSSIRENLTRLGMKVSTIKANSQGVEVKAAYK